jgi:hypothetical protein
VPGHAPPSVRFAPSPAKYRVKQTFFGTWIAEIRWCSGGLEHYRWRRSLTEEGVRRKAEKFCAKHNDPRRRWRD